MIETCSYCGAQKHRAHASECATLNNVQSAGCEQQAAVHQYQGGQPPQNQAMDGSVVLTDYVQILRNLHNVGDGAMQAAYAHGRRDERAVNHNPEITALRALTHEFTDKLELGKPDTPPKWPIFGSVKRLYDRALNQRNAMSVQNDTIERLEQRASKLVSLAVTARTARQEVDVVITPSNSTDSDIALTLAALKNALAYERKSHQDTRKELNRVLQRNTSADAELANLKADHKATVEENRQLIVLNRELNSVKANYVKLIDENQELIDRSENANGVLAEVYRIYRNHPEAFPETGKVVGMRAVMTMLQELEKLATSSFLPKPPAPPSANDEFVAAFRQKVRHAAPHGDRQALSETGDRTPSVEYWMKRMGQLFRMERLITELNRNNKV